MRPRRQVTYVYALCAPRFGGIRYIGMTETPTERLRGHFADRTIIGKRDWLRAAGADLRVLILDVCGSRARASRSERAWIAHGRAAGWHLFNGAPRYIHRAHHRRTHPRARAMMRAVRRYLGEERQRVAEVARALDTTSAVVAAWTARWRLYPPVVEGVELYDRLERFLVEKRELPERTEKEYAK